MPQERLSDFPRKDAEQVGLQLGICGFASACTGVFGHRIFEYGHSFFNGLEGFDRPRVQLLDLSSQHFQANASAVVHLTDQPAPCVEAIEALRSAEHGLGRAA